MLIFMSFDTCAKTERDCLINLCRVTSKKRNRANARFPGPLTKPCYRKWQRADEKNAVKDFGTNIKEQHKDIIEISLC